MSISAVTLCVECAYEMPQSAFKRALLVATVKGNAFSHLSDFCRWLADSIESFGVADFVHETTIPYHEYPGGQRAASDALLDQWARWFPTLQPPNHTINLSFTFTAHDLECSLARAAALRQYEDSPYLDSLHHRDVLDLCISQCLEEGRDAFGRFQGNDNAEPFLMRQCTDTVRRLFPFLL